MTDLTIRSLRLGIQAIRTDMLSLRGKDTKDRVLLGAIHERIERIDRRLFEAWLEGMREEVA